MATTECRTRVRGLDVYDDSSLPAQLRLTTPKVASQWTGWSCAVTGTLRVRKRGRKIECIRVSVVSTVVDEIAPDYSPAKDLYTFGALISTFGLARRNEIFLHVVLQGGEHFTACRIDIECDLPPPVSSR
ncbi:MAG: hypothetical protein ACREX6_06645, partial [Casimicrobiaceae bacterium]